jgi:hypothetical protein
MSAHSVHSFDQRKAMLATQASLDRMRLTLAVQEIRSVISPAPSAETTARSRSTATTLLRYALPLVGAHRLSRWLRVASLAFTAYRIARHWRRH